MTRTPAQDADRAGSVTGGWWCLFVVAAAVLYLFRRAIFADETLLVRDAAHFYAPLWEWARGEWGQGRIPLWDPFQNLGEPHLADNSSSVFYPGKLLFLWPGDFQRLYHVFLVAHVALAALTMFRLVRAWQGSVSGAGLAAVSYCLSGCILFQYCNPPFLIGAAWLPAAVAAAERMLRERNVTSLVWLAAVLALMVLGGDAQTVYHVGLMMMLLAWMRRRQAEWGFVGGLGWITLAAAVTLVLAAVQVLPTASRTAASDRATFDQPRSLYELASSVGRDRESSESLGAAALLGRTRPGMHHDRAFQFSVGPWRWLELVWPNVGGRMFPDNARWMSCLPAEGRVWAPTLYMGLLPVLLAVCRVRCWRTMPPPQVWIAIATALSILAGMGVYGGGWLADELRHAGGRAPDGPLPFGGGFGGLYWFMTVLLPDYVYFRYPAKLWTIAACGLSLLAGMGWDQELSSGARNLQRGLRWLGCLSAGLLITALLTLAPWLQVATARAAPHALLGPFDPTAAFRDITGALAQTAILCGGCWGMLKWWARRETRAVGVLLIGITAAELIVAQHWLVPTAKIDAVNGPVDAFRGSPAPPVPPRIYRGNSQMWRPAAWAAANSTDRLAEIVRWDRQSLFPHYHHAVRCGLLDSPTTIRSRDWSALAQVAQQYGPSRQGPIREFSQEVVDVLGVTHRILPPNTPENRAFAAAGPALPLADGVELSRNTGAFPRAWVASTVIQRPPLHAPNWPTVLERTREIWFPGGQPRDLRRTAVVETHRRLQPTAPLTQGRCSCHIETYEPQRIVITASLAQNGLVVLSDGFDPGWRAWARRKGAAEWVSKPILRTNRVLKGVNLERGEYEIVFRYVPADFLAGLALTGVGWGAWLALVLRSVWRPFRFRFLHNSAPL